MSQFVRTLDEIGNWGRNPNPQLSWLEDQEFQSNILRDLRPISGNSVSVFEVTEDVDAERIVVAIAAGKQNIDKCDYVMLDGDALDANGFKLRQKKGNTQDDEVNAVHFDLIELGMYRLITFAVMISNSIDLGQHYRLFDEVIEKRIDIGLNTGQLKNVPPRLKRELLRKRRAGACDTCSRSGDCSDCNGIGYLDA